MVPPTNFKITNQVDGFDGARGGGAYWHVVPVLIVCLCTCLRLY